MQEIIDKLDQLQAKLESIDAQLARQQEALDRLQDMTNHVARRTRTSKVPNSNINIEEIRVYIENAKSYKDKQFSYFLEAGFMPRRKLLKLAKCPSSQLDQLLRVLLAMKKIEQVNLRYPNQEGSEIGYRLP